MQKPPESVQVTALAYEIKNEDGAKSPESVNPEIRVVVDTDDVVEQVQADSLDKAIDLIKQRIDTIAHRGGQPEQNAAQLRALKQAVADLVKARAEVVKSNETKGLAKMKEERLYLARVDSDIQAKFTAERKEQIDKARSRVESLRKEFEEKRQQLTNAQRDLQKLRSAGARVEVHVRDPLSKVETQPHVVHDTPVQVRGALQFRANEPAPASASQPKAATALSPSDKDRLELLEKQLAKLLAEVASLKKHEEKGK